MRYHQMNPQQVYMGRLEYGQDLITSIETFSVQNRIDMGWFSVIGAVSSATLGYYDQKQMVYVTAQTDCHLEIASCTGNISLKEGKPFVHAHALLSDEKSQVIGGHLFSETIVFAGEIIIQAFSGKPLNRKDDPQTGLMLWNIRDKSP